MLRGIEIKILYLILILRISSHPLILVACEDILLQTKISSYIQMLQPLLRR